MTFDTLKEHATRWKLGAYIIEERWNPNHKLAQTIEYPHPNKDEGLYAITKELMSSFVYSKSEGGFIYEPRPSNRSDEFILDTRFTLKEAYEVIKNEVKNP